MRRVAPLAVVLALSISSSPAQGQEKQTYFRYEIERVAPKPASLMAESLTLSVDGIDVLGVSNLFVSFTTRFSREGETYWGPDSVEIRVESYTSTTSSEAWPHASDHSFALVVGDTRPRNLGAATYDTLSVSNSHRETIQSEVSSTDAAKLITANRIEGRVGATTFFLNREQLVALRAFLKRSLTGPFAP